jgi:hypothetical protein
MSKLSVEEGRGRGGGGGGKYAGIYHQKQKFYTNI